MSLPKESRWQHALKSTAFKISLALATLLLLLLALLSAFAGKGNPYECGNSPIEAVSKNCHFDLLAFAWVPIQCFDAELSSAYDPYHDFEFFYDRNRTRQIPIRELEKGINPRVYTSGKYHRTHCTYAWQTLQRAVLRGYGLSDNKTLNAGHYDHCSYYLINIDPNYRARFHMEYLHCERVGRK
ncbi:hypothetical protein BDV96DRAFT_647536 [Lophiotrema nucula]|uniref:Uncharacterized protein n=1 Tax=Lophiotrema nucula TaxID=690887 RepID=A0A6A5Z6L3_9PLEO|nr:hypothetical protein BDV96DRAFT_647536 [Lophiotrema nucula]